MHHPGVHIQAGQGRTRHHGLPGALGNRRSYRGSDALEFARRSRFNSGILRIKWPHSMSWTFFVPVRIHDTSSMPVPSASERSAHSQTTATLQPLSTNAAMFAASLLLLRWSFASQKPVRVFGSRK